MDKPTYFLTKIILSYLRKSGYRLDAQDFHAHLISNPTYPSIKSVTDTLDYFGVSNLAAMIPRNSILELPEHFLAVLKIDEKNSFAAITRNGQRFQLTKDDGSTIRSSSSELRRLWDGPVVVIEPQKATLGQVGHAWKSILLLALITIIAVTLNFQWISAGLAVLGILGIMISYFIVREDLGLFSKSTAKLCESTTANTSCAEVVSSDASKILGAVSLSDLSVVYFTSLFLVISLLGYNDFVFDLLAWGILPMIGYSLYTQGVTLKKWCPLCLGVVAVLALQVILTNPLDLSLVLNWEYVATSGLIAAVVGVVWYWAGGLIKRKLALDQVRQDYLTFKRHEHVFDYLFHRRQLKYPVETTSPHSLLFGDAAAPVVITAITNPTCGFCSDSFKVYLQMIESHPQQVALNVVFNIYLEKPEATAVKVAQRVMQWYQLNPPLAFEALKNWYLNREFTSWQERYALPPHAESPGNLLWHHVNWCVSNEIAQTPITIINDQYFPKEYDIEDLPLFTEWLIEEAQEKSEPAVRQAL